MNKRFLTLEDLINYFESNQIQSFSSKESGAPIVVQAENDGFVSFDNDYSKDGRLYAKVRVCHTLLNKNKSYISEENMTRCMPTLKYAPLLAKIHQLDDGSWDFHTHDMHVEVDEDGNETIVYDEQQIGTFTAADPYLEYDKTQDRTYVVAQVAIPEEYTRAASIIKEKGETKVRCELAVYDCVYNAKEKYLELTDFVFSGCTCLGSETDGTAIQEGMLGSKLTLEDFSAQNNSVMDKILNEIDILNQKIDNIKDFALNKTEKGGIQMTLFEELLAEYNKTSEDIDFEYENMTDEELKEKFEELFGEEDTDTDTDDDPVVDDETDSESFNLMVRTYEISHEDIRYALYNLLAPYEEADNEWYFINAVYDDHFAYENWTGDKIYGQKYTVDDDNVSLDGERYTLHRELLTDSEYASLQAMRENYSALVEFKDNTEKAIETEKKEAIINSEKYSAITEKNKDGKYVIQEFAELVDNMDSYSVEEFETKVKVIHSDFISNNKDLKDSSMKVFGNIQKKSKPKKKYGNLFDN